MDDEKMVYTVEEAAKILGVSKGMLYTNIRNGTFPALRIGRLVRIAKATVDNALSNTGVSLDFNRPPDERIGPPRHVDAEEWAERQMRELEIRTKLAGGQLY